MLMLKKMGSELENDSAIVTQTAEVLELSFRKHIETEWPDFGGITSYFIARRMESPQSRRMTEDV
jgi:hypothetical protein